MTKYTTENVFVRKEKNFVYLGVSELFVETLNRVEFIDFPNLEEIIAGDTLCLVDTVDETFDFPCPVSGEVVEINEELKEDPLFITDDTEFTGWICKIKMNNKEEFNDLMNFHDYKHFVDGDETYL